MASSVKFANAYRALGRPKLQTKSSFRFRAEQYNTEVVPALLELLASQAGRFDEILIDDKEVDDTSKLDIEYIWSKLEFTYKLSSSGETNVYQSFQQLLIECKIIARGGFPEIIYLIEENICSQDSEILTHRLENLRSLCNLITCLADLAHYHDEKLKGEEYRLIFVENDGAKGAKTITLQPSIDPQLLEYNVSSNLFDTLLESNFDKNPQIVKERSIFRASLVEFSKASSDAKDRFKLLVANWDSFLRLYNNNLDTYLSGFSFHKAKQEVGAAELSIADQLSKLISDVSGKVLSIPISLIAIIALAKVENNYESAVLVLGITLTSLIIAETLAAQKLQYKRICHSRTLLFSAHEKKIEIYPEDLRQYLRSAIESLTKNENKLGRSLLALRCLAWIPAIAAVSLHLFIYADNFVASWRAIVSLAASLF